MDANWNASAESSPSLTIEANPSPLRTDPVATVNRGCVGCVGCVGCGLCGENAHATVPFPSFYKAEIIQNASRWERALHRVRSQVIGLLAGRRRKAQGLAS